MENAVAVELILEAIVDMVAAKIAAISKPATPMGIWLIMKKGNIASPLERV